MRLLAEIDHTPGIPHTGRTVTREAVRAIILEGSQLLMIHATCRGDYKFPGGGIKKGEGHFLALTREVNEESGAHIRKLTGVFGLVVEYDRPIEKRYDLFKMISYYYRVGIEPTFGIQHLDNYEYELGFTPEWIRVEEAIAINQTLLREQPSHVQRWVRRETTVLEIIKNELLGSR
jgi:8-oxo-dGTP pyrophosphatase MutT (NUDIX family)